MALLNLSSIEERLTKLETQNSLLETKIVSLTEDNKSLINIIFELHNTLQTQQSTITELQSQKSTDRTVHLTNSNTPSEQPSSAREVSVSSSDEQEHLNSNIILRGLDISSEAEQETLSKIYQGLRKYIGVDTDTELDPISISLLPAKRNSKYLNKRPVVIQLKSIAAKKKLLQIKRINKNISTQDIEFQQEHNRFIKITEQLTRENQDLFYKACSLRDIRDPAHKFKFVWTSNGQILARRKEKSEVLRIKSIDQINSLRIESNDG